MKMAFVLFNILFNKYLFFNITSSFINTLNVTRKTANTFIRNRNINREIDLEKLGESVSERDWELRLLSTD